MKKIISLLTICSTIITYGQNATTKNWSPAKNLQKATVYHGNKDLDITLNYFNADIVATFSKCQDKATNIEKANCFITNLIIYTADEIHNSTIIKNSNLKKGTKKIRVLFIIDKKGKVHVKQVLGNWSKPIINEVSKIIESTPNIIPAKQSGHHIPVKFSINIPFIIK